MGTLRQAQCIAGDTSASSVHRWGLIAKITGFLFFYEYARKIFSETAAGR
ncbi:MAG: hypothetical protein ACFKPT_07665 [Gloeotrichia echinulata GP01]